MKESIGQFENVQGDEEKSLPEPEQPKEGKKSKKEKIPLTKEEYERYREEGQKMVDSYDKFFKTFAKDISLKFRLSNAFYIDFDKGECHMDTKWFAERGFSKDQIIWANYHELSHFVDFSEDPEAMLENFDYIRSQAKQTAAIIMGRYEEKFTQANPEFLDKVRKSEQPRKVATKTSKDGKKQPEPMTPMQQAAYKIHHTFYNILDDIYVNNLVQRKAPKYEENRPGGREIKKLYKEQLFTESDYSKLPRHLQFAYSMLREEMIKDEKVITTDEISDVFERKIKFQGKEYAVKEIIEKLIKPKTGRDTKPSQRYFAIKRTLEPIFNELLQKDLEEWTPKDPQEKIERQKGDTGEQQEQEVDDMNPFEEDYEQFEENNPDQISEEEIRKWVNKQEEKKEEDKKKEAKKEELENQTSEQKAQSAQDVRDKKWAAEHGVSQESLKKFRNVEKEIEPYLQDLSLLWRHIIMGSTPIVERGREGYFKTGELDIAKVIEDYPKIERKELDDVRVMKRIVSKERLVQKPELIRVRLVGDMSGSMAGDASKRHLLQQCFILILSSLREFNTYLNMDREKTKSKLEVDSEAWTFGSGVQKIKKLRSETGQEDEQVEIVKIFEHLEEDMGGTNDDLPLKEILSSITPEERQKISQEKIMEIVFEITDGGSNNAPAAEKAVTALDELGVIIKAFQIGQVSTSEENIFNHVWNKGRGDKLGEVVGEKIENLLPALTEALKKYLGNVRL